MKWPLDGQVTLQNYCLDRQNDSGFDIDVIAHYHPNKWYYSNTAGGRVNKSTSPHKSTSLTKNSNRDSA